MKSLFISSFLTFCAIVSGWAIWQMFVDIRLVDIGVLLSALPFLLVIAYFFIIGTARTSAHLWPMLLVSTIGLLLVTYLNLSSDTTYWFELTLASVAGIGSWLYVFWYSKFDSRESHILQESHLLPQFPLVDINGTTISSQDFIGKQNLIIFYRGNWCPLCMTQIKEVADNYTKLVRNGVRIALISPQPPSHTKALAKKFDVGFEYYIDKDNQAAKQLNILAANGLPVGLQVFGYDSDTVMPTVIITDKENRIIFADMTDNYRVRPEPAIFEKILYGEKY